MGVLGAYAAEEPWVRLELQAGADRRREQRARNSPRARGSRVTNLLGTWLPRIGLCADSSR